MSATKFPKTTAEMVEALRGGYVCLVTSKAFGWVKTVLAREDISATVTARGKWMAITPNNNKTTT